MLHIVNKSPFERNALDSCLRVAKADSAILLIEDAVYAALAGTAKSDLLAGKSSQYGLFVLGPDLQARGLSDDQVMDGVKIVDYDGFVDLVAENESSLSWL